MNTVIFACVHNAGRSQMAAAFFNEMASPACARAISAGTRPTERVHPGEAHRPRVVVEAPAGATSSDRVGDLEMAWRRARAT
jgi:protein-tyrosine-phosphatase